MIRERQLSATEVLNAYLKQIDKHNHKLNAIAALNRERAIKREAEAGKALDEGENWGILHGVPIIIKDTSETKGILSTADCSRLKDYVPQQDAIAVERLKAAGAITMAKTNCPTLAADRQTNNFLLGRTNNPWNPDYTPGGSRGEVQQP